eukprot:UN02232
MTDKNIPKWAPPVLGAIAGAISEFLVLPLMAVKTRLMVQGCAATAKEAGDVVLYNGFIDAAIKMHRNEGYRVFFKGATSMLTFTPLGRGIYMFSVETTRKLIGSSPTKDFIAGMVGQLIGSIGFLPRDIITERCQIEGQVKTIATYNSSWNALKSVWQTEGMRGFYRAYWPHQSAWVPFNGSYWMFYGRFKERTAHMEQTVALKLSP